MRNAVGREIPDFLLENGKEVYQGKNYTDDMPYAYFARSKDYITMHPETKAMLEEILLMLKEKVEKKTFAYIRKLFLRLCRKRQ